MSARIQYTDSYESPIGKMLLACDGKALTGLWFEEQKYFGATLTSVLERRTMSVLEQTKRWLDVYFAQEGYDQAGGSSDEKMQADPFGRVYPELPPLAPAGSAFRKAVWDILLTIPFGKTMTYGEIAKRIADQNGLRAMSAQAVGGAVGHNPISILIPCHRVIGADGSLTGYAGGIEKKRWLLAHEQK